MKITSEFMLACHCALAVYAWTVQALKVDDDKFNLIDVSVLVNGSSQMFVVWPGGGGVYTQVFCAERNGVLRPTMDAAMRRVADILRVERRPA